MTINVTNNPDGTYTVVCGSEIALVGMPLPTLPPISPVGGRPVAHIINIADEPSRGTRVDDANEILEHLRVASEAAQTAGPGATPALLEFSLPGYHTIDIGEICSTISKAGQGNLSTRIFVGKIK
jgi:hypothetical protein